MTCTELLLISKWVWWLWRLWWWRQSKSKIKNQKFHWNMKIYSFRHKRPSDPKRSNFLPLFWFWFQCCFNFYHMSLDIRLLFLKLIESCRHFLEPNVYSFLSVTFTPYYVTHDLDCRRESSLLFLGISLFLVGSWINNEFKLWKVLRLRKEGLQIGLEVPVVIQRRMLKCH